MILVALAVAVYLNALTNPFVFDDRTEVVENGWILDIWDSQVVLGNYLGNLSRPVVNLTYAIDYAGWGLNPFGYHLTNLLLHVAVVLLLAQVGRRMMEDWSRRGPAGALRLPPPAEVGFWAAAVFAVHPLMTEAVGYVSGRSEMVCGIFFLGGVLLLRRAALEMSFKWTVVAFVALVLGLGSKEVAGMLPLVFLLYDRLFLVRPGEFTAERFWKVHALGLVLIALAAPIRMALLRIVDHPTGLTMYWAGTLFQPEVASRYLLLLAAPVSQSVVHQVYPVTSPADLRFIVPGVAWLGLFGAAWLLRRRLPVFTFGVGWFALLLVPSAALALLNLGQTMAEHRVYLASGGFFLLVGYGFARATGRSDDGWRFAHPLALILVLVVLSVLTVNRNRVWADPVRLWADAAAKAPNTWAANYGLADALRSQGDCERAAASYQRAAMLLPTRLEAFYGLASCLTETGRIDDARHVLLMALARNPESPDAHLILAEFYEEIQKNPAEAFRLCTRAKALGADARIADDCVARNQNATAMSRPQ